VVKDLEEALPKLTTAKHGELLAKVEKVPRRGNMYAAGYHGSMESGKTIVAYAAKHTVRGEEKYDTLFIYW
jgi:hypothetical protein